MIESIFSRVFSYRQRDNHSPLENFLTEIFAFCISVDPNFRSDFFKNILSFKSPKTEIKISTQDEYHSLGRPDIELCFDDTAILIECKVEAGERFNQLNDYASILINHKQDYCKKHIVFLTKYFEHKELNHPDVKLHLVRWFEVFELINDRHNEITQQLKLFLKEQNMEKVKNFTIQDLLAMKTIPETITKMDELLEQFKPEFEKRFGGYSKDSSRSTQLPNGSYINYVTLAYQKIEYWLLIGFFWDEAEIPDLGLSLQIPKRKFEGSDLTNIFQKELIDKNKWKLEDHDSFIYFSAIKPISEFITLQDDNIPSMKKYIEANLKTLLELKDKYPKLLRK